LEACRAERRALFQLSPAQIAASRLPELWLLWRALGFFAARAINALVNGERQCDREHGGQA